MKDDAYSRFLGREKELTILRETWKLATKGRPQAVTVLAPSGFGKTRLVHQFYRSVVEEHDPQNSYWPDSIDGTQYRGRVNPDIDLQLTSNIQTPQFLWWGLRLDSPSQKTGRQESALSNGNAFLAPHILAYEDGVKREALAKELAKAGVKGSASIAVDVALNVLSGGLFSIITGVGKTVGETGLDMARMSIDNNLTSRDFEKQKDTLGTRLLLLIEKIVRNPPRRLDPIPACIIIDEAQWADGDEGLRDFIHDLLLRAGESNWPLMLIVLSWPGEWNRSATGHGDQVPGLKQIWDDPIGYSIDDVTFQTIDLGRLEDMGIILKHTLPGLTAEQVDIFLGRADGNPLYLRNQIDHAMRKSRWFENFDFAAPLTEAGQDYFKTVSYEDVLEEQLLSSPVAVRETVGIGGMIGMRFSRLLAVRMAARMAIENPENALAVADREHGLITDIAARGYEFRQRRYQEVARQLLLDNADVAKLNAIRQESENELVQQAVAGEIAMRELPLEALARPEDATADRLAQWVKNLAFIVYNARQKSDVTEINYLVSLYTDDGGQWLDKLPLETAPSNPVYRDAILNLCWLAEGVSLQLDSSTSIPFMHKLALRFLGEGWMNHISDTEYWAWICSNIADVLRRCIFINNNTHIRSKDYIKAGLHYINLAKKINPDVARYDKIKTILLNQLYQIHHLNGYQDKADKVMAELDALNGYTFGNDIPDTWACSTLQSISNRLARKAEAEDTQNLRPGEAIRYYEEAHRLAKWAYKKCGCSRSLRQIAYTTEKLLSGKYNRYTDNEAETTASEIREAILNRDGYETSVDLLAHLAGIELIMGNRYMRPRQFQYEPASKHYNEAIKIYNEALITHPAPVLKNNRAIAQLSLGRLLHLVGHHDQWCELRDKALPILANSYPVEPMNRANYLMWFDNAVLFSISVGRYEDAYGLAKQGYQLFLDWKDSSSTANLIFLAAALQGRGLGIEIRRICEKHGIELTLDVFEAVPEAISDELSKSGSIFLEQNEWLKVQFEDYGFTEEHVSEYVRTGTRPNLG